MGVTVGPSRVIGVVVLVGSTLLPAVVAPTSAGAMSGPTPSGSLSISGTLKDGSTVTAGGVTWTPAPCTGNGVCSEAVTASYRWKACSSGGCGPTAITDTRSNLASLLLGSADAGKTIRVTETAIDVRTDGTEQTAHVSVQATAVVARWPAGTAPRVDFIDGVPESSTASTREDFVLSSPHANPVDGSVTVACSVDGGAASATCGSTATLTTPSLETGPHSVQVQASNGAGTASTIYSWKVVDAAPPTGCPSCFHPPRLAGDGQPMTWDWQLSVDGSSLVYRTVDLFDIDGFNNRASVVAGIHARPGRTLSTEKAICYLSLGSWENFRADAAAWPTAAIGVTLAGYPNERWVDVRQLSALAPVIDSRLQMCSAKGFDGVEVDNIDGWSGNATGFSLTREDAQAWLAYIANEAHVLGLFVIWKNDPYLASWATSYFDGALSEECYRFRECTQAQNAGTNGCNLTTNRCGVELFADAGKWVGEVEYDYVCAPSDTTCGRRHLFSNYCAKTWGLTSPGFGLAAWKADLALDGRTFDTCWP